MASVGIRELRQRAGELPRRVEDGESIEITDRGRPVAVLGPLPADPMARLRAAGDLKSSEGELAELPALRRYLSRRQPPVSSALARTEVARALLPSGSEAVARGEQVLRRIQPLRVNGRLLSESGRMVPAERRSLDAIHLASARELGSSVRQIVAYEERTANASRVCGWAVASPR